MTVAGAAGACTFGEPEVIGEASNPVRVSLGFGAKGGLAAWLDASGRLRTRALDPSGAPLGVLLDGIALEKGERPFGVEPLGVDFVVTVARSERVNNRMVHHRRAVLVRPDGQLAGRFAKVGEPDVWRRLPRTESRGGSFGFVGWRGDELGADQPALWIETYARADGTIVEEARPVEPALTTQMGEYRGRVAGEGPLAMLLARSGAVVIEGRATRIKNASLSRIDWRDRTVSGRWMPGGGAGLLGGPDRHLRIVWFEGDKVHAADVRADGTTTGESTFAPLAAIPSFPDELEVWGGGIVKTTGFTPSFSRERTFLPRATTVKGASSVDKRFVLPDVTLDGGKELPIEDGSVAWSGARIVYVYREGAELRSRAGTCSGAD